MADRNETNEQAPDPEEIPTSSELINEKIEQMRNSPETDTELLAILEEHVLTDSPANTAVKDAVAAIEQLAEKRLDASGNDGTHQD